MNLLSGAISLVALFGLLFFVDRKIKGNNSIFIKIISLVFFASLIVTTVYFYGAGSLESFQVDVKSFTKIKAFFSSRIVTLLILVVVMLFVLFKSIHVTLSLFNSCPQDNKESLAKVLFAIVFDLATVPNILAIFGDALILLPIVISLTLEGLALIKLVFSNRQKEVLA